MDMPYKNLRKRREYHRVYMNSYWERNKERMKEIFKKNHIKTRTLALEKYGGKPPKCACCGETIIEFLGIDHINGGGNKHRMGKTSKDIYRWLLRTRKKPKQFQVLCHNCNCAKGYYGYCPHEKNHMKAKEVK